MAHPVSGFKPPVLPTASTTEAKGVTVLIADDCMMTHRIVSVMLERVFGQKKVPVNVVGVTNGANAREALCNREFLALSPNKTSLRAHNPCNVSLVLMDQQFPERVGTPAIDDEGEVVTRDVRAHEAKTHKQIPVKIVAHSATEQQEVFTRAKGYDAKVKKASPKATFEAVLHEIGAFDLSAPGGEAGPSE